MNRQEEIQELIQRLLELEPNAEVKLPDKHLDETIQFEDNTTMKLVGLPKDSHLTLYSQTAVQNLSTVDVQSFVSKLCVWLGLKDEVIGSPKLHTRRLQRGDGISEYNGVFFKLLGDNNIEFDKARILAYWILSKELSEQ